MVEPREVARLALSRSPTDDSDTNLFECKEHVARGGDVLEPQRTRLAKDLAQSPRAVHGLQCAISTDLGPREPDLFAAWPPGQTLDAAPPLREPSHFPVEAHQNHGAHVADAGPVVQQGDVVAAGGEARMSNPARRLVEHRADRGLETVAAARVAHDGETLPIRRPVRPLHAMKPLARCLAA